MGSCLRARCHARAQPGYLLWPSPTGWPAGRLACGVVWCAPGVVPRQPGCAPGRQANQTNANGTGLFGGLHTHIARFATWCLSGQQHLFCGLLPRPILPPAPCCHQRLAPRCPRVRTPASLRAGSTRASCKEQAASINEEQPGAALRECWGRLPCCCVALHCRRQAAAPFLCAASLWVL